MHDLCETAKKIVRIIKVIHKIIKIGTVCVLYNRIPVTRTSSSAIAEGPRDSSCQLKSCQLPRNRAETTYTTSPGQIDGMKLEI